MYMCQILLVYEQLPLVRSVRYSSPTDPMWNMQWALVKKILLLFKNFILVSYVCQQKNTGQVGMEYHHRDLNVEPAWLQGLTGRGVVVAIVDDGRLVIYYSCAPHNPFKKNIYYVNDG